MEPTPTNDNLLIIKKAGLTNGQAKAYLTLIEQGSSSPADLAKKIGESRTNTYMICEKLNKLGLISKTDAKKTTYKANHPSSLELLAEHRRKILLRNEQEVKRGLSHLVNLFYTVSEMPGARTLEGIDGIKEVFADVLRTKKDVFLIRTKSDITADGIGKDFLDQHREKRAKLNIHTYAITPDTPEARKIAESGEDERLFFHRTFIEASYYTAPVEFQVYGDKVALISYGKTQMSIIINSPTVAEAIRQLCQIIVRLLSKPPED